MELGCGALRVRGPLVPRRTRKRGGDDGGSLRGTLLGSRRTPPSARPIRTRRRASVKRSFEIRCFRIAEVGRHQFWRCRRRCCATQRRRRVKRHSQPLPSARRPRVLRVGRGKRCDPTCRTGRWFRTIYWWHYRSGRKSRASRSPHTKRADPSECTRPDARSPSGRH